MNKRILLFLTYLFMMVGMVTAQVSRVTGTVTSEEDGLPVLGASIVVKGTTLGTLTDADGKFTLSGIPSSAKLLVVSYVGMVTREVAIKSNLNIMLYPDEGMLDEVMVVAYGTAKKSAFTGSAAVVSTEQIEKVQTSNVVDALNGKVSGVQMMSTSNQPGQSDPTIRIRGISSINAGNAPLIVLDGTPYDGDMNNINAADIESMTVLKDAASNALYGARGANGVIVITTKSGKNNQEAKVSLDAKWGSNSRGSRLYDYITSPSQYYETYYQYLNNYATDLGYNATGAAYWANQNMINGSYGLAYNVFDIPEGEYLIGSNGKLNANATLGRLVNYGGETYYLTADNWLDEAYKNSLRQEYNVSVTNSNDRSSFYASFGYLNNEGITAASDYTRYTARFKGDLQAKKWLKFTMNTSFTHFDSNFMTNDGTSNSSGNIFAVASQMAPIYPLYMRDANGNIIKDEVGNTRYDYGDGKYLGLTRPEYTGTNALSDAVLDTNALNGNAFNGTAGIEIRLPFNIKFSSNNTISLDETRTTYVTNPYYGSYSSSNGIIYKYHTRALSTNYQQLLNWGKEFGKHSLDLMAGHESYVYNYTSLQGSKSNMFDPTNSELSGAITTISTYSYTTKYMTEGWFGRAQYDFDDKYFLSASFRRDASSRFDPDHQWGNFFSFGGAWLLSKESWFKVDAIDELKLKASYGEQGNDNIGDYRYTNTYNIVNANGNVAVQPNVLGNKEITWETGSNFNAGLELSMFKGRFTAQVEYFYRKTSDMLFAMSLPPTYGYTYYYDNVGDMRNSGLELELRADIIKTKNFSWNMGFNATTYKNKITYLDDNVKVLSCDGYNGYTSGSRFYGENLPIYTYRLRKYAGVDNATGEDLYYYTKEDGSLGTTNKASSADYYLCGTALPDIYGGFDTSFQIFDFDLSANFSYQLGGQVYDSDYQAAMTSPTTSMAGYALHKDLLNAWTEMNTNSNIPRLVHGDDNAAYSSDRFLTSARYLSLQNVTIGYTLPRNICRKMSIDRLRIYFTADNVWYTSARKGLDPRQSTTGTNYGASLYAPIRTLSLGLQCTF